VISSACFGHFSGIKKPIPVGAEMGALTLKYYNINKEKSIGYFSPA
jgi:hypothetical protein